MTTLPEGVRTYETAQPTPETFDLTAWMEGLAPTKRACTIYARADLLSQLDLLAEKIRRAERAGQEATPLREQFLKLKSEVEASALDIVVRAWSQTRIKRNAQALKEEGITDPDEVGLHQIAQQIESPTGFGVDQLRKLNEISPQQASLIAATVVSANQGAVEVKIPF